jgi:hypothetical protein
VFFCGNGCLFFEKPRLQPLKFDSKPQGRRFEAAPRYRLPVYFQSLTHSQRIANSPPFPVLPWFCPDFFMGVPFCSWQLVPSPVSSSVARAVFRRDGPYMKQSTFLIHGFCSRLKRESALTKQQISCVPYVPTQPNASIIEKRKA